MPVALIRKGLLHSAIKKRKKELRSLRNHAAVYEKDLAKSLSFIDKYILDSAIKKTVYKLAINIIKPH